MIIHVVQKDENINSIAEMYGKDTERLIQENGIINPDNLALGQTIVIVEAKELYKVEEGDTLASIAESKGISVLQLLRNNPYTINREFIYLGESLVIQFQDEKVMKIATNGYVFPHVELKTLEKNLLFLTYLSIFSYFVTADGNIKDIDDINIIRLAKLYGVAPVMIISFVEEEEDGRGEIVHIILSDELTKKRFIDNIQTIVQQKEYEAINLSFTYIRTEDVTYFGNFIVEVSERFHREGVEVFVTFTPRTFEIKSESEVEYSLINKSVDQIYILSYDWASETSMMAVSTPFYFVRSAMELFTNRILPEKIMMGATTIGYMWDLPYFEGISKTNSINYNNAILLASETNSMIYYNEENVSSYFYFSNPNLNLVYFRDARGFEAYNQMMPDFGLHGIALWNVMYDITQIFFILNTQYEIENLEV
jgi:spore germination protein